MTNNSTILAHYYFISCLREGLATLISENATGARARVDIQLKASGTGGSDEPTETDIAPPGGIELYGPGDIVGFNESVITRREPERDVGDREPNYFPLLEFEQPDFPWRYTAALPVSENGRLNPWIALIVLIAEGEDKEFDYGCQYSSPNAPCITVHDDNSLPDINEAWRWAHVQITTDGFIENNRRKTLTDIIRNDPDRVVSRLVCARRLRTGTLYQAFVVPTFKLGVFAGLGIEPVGDITALTPAWESGSGSTMELPFYYTWQFRTGLRGDFEALVRRLEPRKLTGLGMRDVDCTKPGYGVQSDPTPGESEPEPLILGLEGALMSLDMEPTKWGHDSESWSESGPHDAYQTKLSELVNQPKADIANGTTLPKLVPPVYGRWHAAIEEVEANKETWIDVLNLDPRHRMVSAFGTKVVQNQQEQLMASAWDQVGAIDEANEILRRAQLGREASLRIHAGRLQKMPKCDLIRVTSPVHSRVLMEQHSGSSSSISTVRHHFGQSRIPRAALDSTFRRLWRRRGPVRKRQQTDRDPERKDILERLNDGTLRAAGPHPDPDGAMRVCQISFEMLKRSGLTKVAERLCPDQTTKDLREIAKALNLFCEENITCMLIGKMPGRPDYTRDPKDLIGKTPQEGKDNEAAADFRNFLLGVCEWLEPPAEEPDPGPVDLDEIQTTLLKALDPAKTIVSRTLKRLRLKDVPERVGADPLDPIMAAPEFDAAMYKPLAEISQDMLLPGLEIVPQNTLGLLKTNGRFLESYMVGLNHEMARELLWREYPTDQRGSYFRQFWDVNNYIPIEGKLESLLDEFLDEKGVQNVADLTEDDKKLIILRNEKIVGDVSGLSEVRLNLLIERLLRENLLEEKLKDIKKIHAWRENKLGGNDNRDIPTGKDDESIVLLIRGDLLRKYPNTIIYAVEAKRLSNGSRVPRLPEHFPDPPPEDISEEDWPGQVKHPIFSGELPPDITFLGFDLRKGDVTGQPGWYFVIEERISEARFGMDMPGTEENGPPGEWDELNWDHIEGIQDDVYIDNKVPIPPSDDKGRKWDETSETSSASIGWITLQRPVRIAVHASKMIPEQISE